MSNQKPTFQPRKPMNKMRPTSQYGQNSAFYENHLEVAAFLSRQWKKVSDCLQQKNKGEMSYEVYREKEPNKNLVDFQAFDLEKFLRQQKNVTGKPSS